jgi:hypothetical protein
MLASRLVRRYIILSPPNNPSSGASAQSRALIGVVASLSSILGKTQCITSLPRGATVVEGFHIQLAVFFSIQMRPPAPPQKYSLFRLDYPLHLIVRFILRSHCADH